MALGLGCPHHSLRLEKDLGGCPHHPPIPPRARPMPFSQAMGPKVTFTSGESLKELLNKFGIQVVRLNPKDEAIMVHAFTKRMLPGPFSDSLLRYCPKTFCEIRRRAMVHITAKDRVTKKRDSVDSV